MLEINLLKVRKTSEKTNKKSPIKNIVDLIGKKIDGLIVPKYKKLKTRETSLEKAIGSYDFYDVEGEEEGFIKKIDEIYNKQEKELKAMLSNIVLIKESVYESEKIKINAEIDILDDRITKIGNKINDFSSNDILLNHYDLINEELNYITSQQEQLLARILILEININNESESNQRIGANDEANKIELEQKQKDLLDDQVYLINDLNSKEVGETNINERKILNDRIINLGLNIEQLGKKILDNHSLIYHKNEILLKQNEINRDQEKLAKDIADFRSKKQKEKSIEDNKQAKLEEINQKRKSNEGEIKKQINKSTNNLKKGNIKLILEIAKKARNGKGDEKTNSLQLFTKLVESLINNKKKYKEEISKISDEKIKTSTILVFEKLTHGIYSIDNKLLFIDDYVRKIVEENEKG